MTLTRPPRRYLIPTWLLVLIALAAFVLLLLGDPVPAVGATIGPLPEATGPDPLLNTLSTIAALAVGGLGLLYAHLELNTDVLERFRDWRAARRRRTV
ncbi:MAG: hypothetical protein K2X91_13925 [Thermoleophilia bacterium]|nr:hypothetical protein [Thermoleophilia bacterium]